MESNLVNGSVFGMRIVVIGQAAFGKSVVESLCNAGEDVVTVFCPVDREGKEIDPIKQEAVSRAIPVLQFKRMRDDEAVQAFLETDPDLCVMAFVTDFVPDSMLQAPKLGTIQYHPSMLPLHRGPSSINWPIINGELKTGISIFWPDDGLDTGPILVQKTAAIGSDDTVGSLYYDKLYPLGVQAMVESVALIREGVAPKIPQDHQSATYETWCGQEDGRINWDAEGPTIYNLIRGCDPRPGASARFGAKDIFFSEAKYSARTASGGIPLVARVLDKAGGGLNKGTVAGEIVAISEKGIRIAVRRGHITVATVRVDGIKSSAASWAEAHMAVGDRFT